MADDTHEQRSKDIERERARVAKEAGRSTKSDEDEHAGEAAQEGTALNSDAG